MEFFFLTQNNTVEIIIFILLVVTLIAIWGYDLYNWIDRIRTVFSTGSRRVSDIPHIIQKEDPNIESTPDIVSENIDTTTPTISPEGSLDNQEIMKEISKKDTSNVEKLA